jgi:hypothetical protein
MNGTPLVKWLEGPDSRDAQRPAFQPAQASSHNRTAETVLGTAAPCWAADVTADRLINVDKEPQNWLRNQRTYGISLFLPRELRSGCLLFSPAVRWDGRRELLQEVTLALTGWGLGVRF